MSRNDPPDLFLGGALREIQKKHGSDGYEVNKALEELACFSKSQRFDSTLANDKLVLQYLLCMVERTFSVLFL